MDALLSGEDAFLPRLVGVFFAIFHPQHGPVVLYDVPEGSVAPASPAANPSRPEPSSSPRRSSAPGHPGDLLRSRTYFASDDIDRVSSVPHPVPRPGSPTTPRPDTRFGSGGLLSPPLIHRDLSDHTSLSADQISGLPVPFGADPFAEASSITLRASAGKSAVTIRPPQSSYIPRKQEQDEWRRTSLSTGVPEDDGAPPAATLMAPRLFDFKAVENLLIPPPTLCGRLIICHAPALPPPEAFKGVSGAPRGFSRERFGSDEPTPLRSSRRPAHHARVPAEYKIVSHPVALQHEKYERMNLVYNLCFVFEAGASTTAYEGVVRKCARSLRDLELTSCFLSEPHNLRRMHNVCEQLYEDLNSYCESFLALPDQPHTNFRQTDTTTPRLAVSTPAVAERAMRANFTLPKRERTRVSRSDLVSANAEEDELEAKVLRELGDSEDAKRLKQGLANLDMATAAIASGNEEKDSTSLPNGDLNSHPLAHTSSDITPKPWEREPPHGLGRTVQNAINVKLFPTYPNPPEAQDWDVPVALLNLRDRITGDWDLTMAKVVPFIDGVRHVRRIAQLADADLDLTKQCMEHLLFYSCITMSDIFQFSNIYTVRPLLAREGDNPDLFAECGQYVTRLPYPVVGHAKLLQLFAAFSPTKTVSEWCEEQQVDELGVDPRRFVSFGTLKGWLRRMHRIPVLVSPCLPPNLGGTQPTETSGRSQSAARGRRTVHDADVGVPSPETARSTPAPLSSPQAQLRWYSGAVTGDPNAPFSLTERGRPLRTRVQARELQLIREESLVSQSPRSGPAHGNLDDGHQHQTRSARRRPMANTVAESALLALQSSRPVPDLALEAEPEEPRERDGSLELDSPIVQEEEELPITRPMYGGSASFGPKSRPSVASSTTVVPGILGTSSSSPLRPMLRADAPDSPEHRASGTPERRVTDTPERRGLDTPERRAPNTPEHRGGKSASSFGLAGYFDQRLASIASPTSSGPVSMGTGPQVWARPIPPGLIDFFDGQHNDDAICTRFSASWADVASWIETINREASLVCEMQPSSSGQCNAEHGSPGPVTQAADCPAGPKVDAEASSPRSGDKEASGDQHDSSDDAGPAPRGAAIKTIIM